MAWYDEAVFYHIYPLGLCGCPHENNGVIENHFDKLNEWATHAHDIGCNAIYIGPLFESVGHGYETTDYRRVDTRLGTNDDFKRFVQHCHDMGVKVIVDGVFNHTGREFFAFKDLKQNRENSRYKDWYLDVNFWGNNEYNDGFCYQNWGGYNLLVKLNLYNQEVRDYHFDTVRFWVSEFDIDGIRLDAADVLNHDFMQQLRGVANTVKPDFWLMGEVIHGDYSNWANDAKLHSVTNYELHKGMYSGLNDHNFFEIAHSINRLLGIVGKRNLYTFIDNHDVARIYSKLNNKAHMYDVALMLYTVPGIPSLYYGSEFCIEGDKQRDSDWNLRPNLNLSDMKSNEITQLITKLGKIRQAYKELAYGEYKQLYLTNRQYAFARILNGSCVITALNNDDNPTRMEINLPIQASRAIDLLRSSDNAKGAIFVSNSSQNYFSTSSSNAQQAKDCLGSIASALDTVKGRLDMGADSDTELNALKSALAQLNEKVDTLFKSYESDKWYKHEKTKDEPPKPEEFAVPVEIHDGKIILDIPANKGMVIYVDNN